jgi:hypothetical protein
LLFGYVYFAALQQFYLFNADHAIQIMMARYFSWESRDFYYWGQNRLGSLVPLLLVVPIKLLKLPALASGVACSLGFYFIALFLLFRFASGWREKCAALIWFFVIPVGAYPLVAYTGHPYAPAMALMLAAFGLALSAPPSGGRLVGAGLLMSLACWVSDASVVAIPAIVLLLLRRRAAFDVTVTKLGLFLLSCATLAPCIYYWRAKIGYAGVDGRYVMLATPEMLNMGVHKFFPQFGLMVSSGRTVTTLARLVAAVLVLINPAVLLMPGRMLGESPERPRVPILRFLALHNCSYFVVILIARHSYLGTGEIQRYWVQVVVYSGYMCFVLAARWLTERPRAWTVRAFALAPAAIAIGLTLLNLPNLPRADGPDVFNSINHHWADLRKIHRRGATRVTGGYWTALPLNVLSEFSVLAVPRNFSRTQQFRDQFSASERRAHPQAFYDLR